jgi:hypothetical protein
MARIYFDTNIWNISCDQGIEPEVLLEGLDKQGSTLVIGQNATDELSKTFLKLKSHERAKILFSHLQAYMNAGLRCVAKDVSEMFVAEMWALKGAENSDKFLAGQDVLKINDLISQLARGELPEGFLAGLEAKTSRAREDKDRTATSLRDQPMLKDELLSIDESRFPNWLKEQLKSNQAIRLLVEKLGLRFPTIATTELFEYARALINNKSRLAIGMLRADFYYSWRCARRGSNRGDLLDDLYHVLNASYCDVYATAEVKQSQYTGLILHSTRTAIYDQNNQLLDKWLISIAKRERR